MARDSFADGLSSEITEALHRLHHTDPSPHRSAELQPHVLQQAQPSHPQLPCSLPREILRHHLLSALPPAALRTFRRAAKSFCDDVAQSTVTSIKRFPGTHPLPPNLGCRFPRVARIDLSGDCQLSGGLELFRALQSASLLTSLTFAGCTSLPASFISRQLVEACPRLQVGTGATGSEEGGASGRE